MLRSSVLYECSPGILESEPSFGLLLSAIVGFMVVGMVEVVVVLAVVVVVVVEVVVDLEVVVGTVQLPLSPTA